MKDWDFLRSIMKDTNHVTIQGWMFNRLNIKGNELILFAVIYGFSQNGKSTYKGSLSYISKSIKVSERAVVKLANKLCEKSYIIKIIKPSGNEYRYNPEVIDPIASGYEQNSGVGVNKVHSTHEESSGEGYEQSSDNNNTNNNTNKDGLNFENILTFLNKRTGKRMKVITPAVKQKFKARINEGYTKEDIRKAIINATESTHHKENNFKWLTLEFFARATTLDKYGYEPVKNSNSKKQLVVTDTIPIG